MQIFLSLPEFNAITIVINTVRRRTIATIKTAALMMAFRKAKILVIAENLDITVVPCRSMSAVAIVAVVAS